jgi:hypothetical protein
MNEKDLEKLLAGVRGEASAAGLRREVAAGLEGGLARDMSQFVAELGQLQAASQTQATAVAENTQAVLQNTVTQVSAEGSSTAGKTAQKVLSNALKMMPLVSGVIGLFGGGKQEEPPPLEAYLPPPAVHLEGEVSRAEGGEAYAWELEQYARRGTAPRPAPQITVQVQALDSRSFLDHSAEIAQAVREAMLNSHALNDVVSEL